MLNLCLTVVFAQNIAKELAEYLMTSVNTLSFNIVDAFVTVRDIKCVKGFRFMQINS